MSRIWFLLIFAACSPAFGAPNVGDAGNGAYDGTFVSGEGDLKMLEAIDRAFASTHPSTLMVSLPMLYRRSSTLIP